jgi:hypothetical protein
LSNNVKWSFSGLKQFINCPRQYHEVKVLQNFSIKETEQIRYGKEVHKALEDYTRDGTPLLKNYQRFKPMVDVLLSIPGTRFAEYEMGLTKDRRPCAFKDPEYWVHGIADLIIVDRDTAHVIDYKTGSSRYADIKQLKLMALMVFAHFPDVQRVKVGLLFVMNNQFIPDVYNRNDIDSLWDSFTADLMLLEMSYANDQWPTRPTGLCGWCPVKTCTFHKER